MSDPVLEAAQRAWDYPFPGTAGEAIAVAAATEALRPIRELHRPLFRAGLPYTVDDRVVCNHCLGPIDWPCATARLVYDSAELAELGGVAGD